MTTRFERFMLARGWVRVADMTAAVNMVAADAHVDRLRDLAARDEAVKAFEGTASGLAVELDRLHARMPVLS